jgi:cytochrome P450
MSTTQRVDILSPSFKADPFPFFATQPVYSTTLPDKTSVWMLARYEDVNSLLKDERFFPLVNLSIELKVWVAIVPKVYRMLLQNASLHSEDDPIGFHYRSDDSNLLLCR